MIPFTLQPWPHTPVMAQTNPDWGDDKLDAIIQLGEAGKPEPATITRGYELDTKRRTTISWIRTSDTKATDLFLDVANVALRINREYWNFDLWGYIDSLQYTVYHAGDEFGWHIDCGPKLPPRKLSVSVQLSDPDDYEGGDLQLRVSEEIEVVPRTRGTVVVFPSFVSHRVTPVTRGVRKALVAWIAGPAFR